MNHRGGSIAQHKQHYCSGLHANMCFHKMSWLTLLFADATGERTSLSGPLNVTKAEIMSVHSRLYVGYVDMVEHAQ